MKLRKTIFVIVSCFVSVFVRSAEIPKRISQIIEQIPCSVPESGTFNCLLSGIPCSCYTQSDKYGMYHIGLNLFGQGNADMLNEAVCKRIEMLWLELLLQQDTEAQNKLMQEYGIRMVYCGYPLGVGSFTSLRDALAVIVQKTFMSINCNQSELDFCAKDSNDNTLHIFLPSKRDVVSPFDKKEAERRLYDLLSDADDKYSAISIPDAESFDISDKSAEIWTYSDSHFMIDSLNNEVFYSRKGRENEPIFNAGHPEESLRNLLMGALPEDILENAGITLHFISYDKNLDDLHINAGTFLMFMRNLGLQSYTAHYELTESAVTVLLVMHHPYFNYINMVKVTADNDKLMPGQSISMSADITLFIPQHNIKSLFNDQQNI